LDIGYIAVETFIPPQNYIDRCKLYQLKEVISIDCALCPRITQYSEDDYSYLLWMGDYWVYKDLEYLLSKVKEKQDKQILAVLREPEIDCTKWVADKNFKFYGYDLIEDDTCISAITNCGGFDKAFIKTDVSEYGLIEGYSKAKEIQLKLKEEYPNEYHADCALWAIWRYDQIAILK